jgi:hypothetical protein
MYKTHTSLSDIKTIQLHVARENSTPRKSTTSAGYKKTPRKKRAAKDDR